MEIRNCFHFKFWTAIFELYKKDLKRILSNSPETTKRMVVYRGVSDDYFLKGNKEFFKTNSFISTSFKPYYSLRYLRDKECCFQKIVILPKSKVLFINSASVYNTELEVLINIDSVFYIKTRKEILRSYQNIEKSLSDMCFKQNVKVETSELVLI